jgi:hypothetical protein
MNVKEFYEVYGCYGGTDGTETLLGEFESLAEASALVTKLQDASEYDYITMVKV